MSDACMNYMIIARYSWMFSGFMGDGQQIIATVDAYPRPPPCGEARRPRPCPISCMSLLQITKSRVAKARQGPGKGGNVEFTEPNSCGF